MCGIAGWVSDRQTRSAQQVIDRMTDALAHRGPDDRATLHDRGAWLGHRRLAIIDPTPTGRQPMQFKSLTAVLNGEIYNYVALRKTLQKKRRHFKTRSDTEVLLQAWDEWGTDGMLERIDGMFAFALWDSEARRLVLARDRMGEKPLYYAALPNGGVAFGSELRAVRAHPDVSGELDPTSLRKYLAFDYVPSPRSILVAVNKLEPGHRVEWSEGRLGPPCPYWDMPRARPDLPPRRAADTLWEAIRTAVRSRMVSDVPIGFFLSGGLDSTAVCAAARELSADPIDTFCIGFDDPSFDESEHAQQVADHLGTRHHTEKLAAKDLLDLLPGIVSGLDEPLADPSLVPTHLLARLVRRHVKVALGGDGGDELLLGYPTFGAHAAANAAARLPKRLRKSVLGPAVKALPTRDANWSLDYRLKRFVAGLEYPSFARHFVWIGGTAPHEHRALLEPQVFAAAGPQSPFDDVDRLTGRYGPPDHDLDLCGYLYAKLYLADGVLQKVDRATMAHGLESRAPLLAEEVVTTAARIPVGEKLKRGRTKHVLRQALAGRVPAPILERKKKGFGIPLTRWLKGPLLPLIHELLDPTRLRTQALFKAEEVERLIAEHSSGWRDHRKTLWALLVFQLWARQVKL